VLIAVLCFVIVWKSFVLQNINFYEYFSLYFLSLLGILLLVNTYDLISAYLVIELQALSFYILACFKRTSSFSTEAGLKYFILGSFISGIFLLGAFFIYAFLGTLNINDIMLILSLPLDDLNMKAAVLLGAVLITVSILFKAAVAPFHFWAPDVYEGAPLSSSIIFSIIPKFSIFVFLMRWVSIFITEFAFLKVLLIKNDKPKGFGENHNIAFNLVDSDFYCVLNPDIQFFENPFPDLIDMFDNEITVGMKYNSDLNIFE
jgi:NADH:ubiquinone oxidoreductase subunit 2 (subunit N)